MKEYRVELELTSEEIAYLKSDKVCSKLFSQLSEIRDSFSKDIAMGGCLDGASVETTALNYAVITGKILGINEILEIKPIIIEE